jgi:hypothetical protein
LADYPDPDVWEICHDLKNQGRLEKLKKTIFLLATVVGAQVKSPDFFHRKSFSHQSCHRHD